MVVKLPRTPTGRAETLAEAKHIVVDFMRPVKVRASKWYKQGEKHQDGSYHVMHYNDDADYAIEEEGV